MKEQIEKIQDIITDVAPRFASNKFKSYGDYEKLVKKMIDDKGGERIKEAIKNLKPVPNAEEHFYKGIANKIREMVNVRFE